jgi:PAS domain S-box-containing protein
LPNFLTVLSNNRYGQTGGYLLIAPKLRVIIAATDKARIMEKLPEPGANADIDYFLSGGRGTRIFKNPLDVEILASDASVPTTGWILAVSLPTAEAFSLLHALQIRLLLSAGFLTVLISAVTWWMLNRQLAGLSLANDAVAAQSKDLSVAHVLPVTDDDEIGELVGGFNHLLALLRERDTALIWSEQRFRAIFNAEPECVKLVAENGDVLEMNTAGLNMLEATTLEEVRKLGLDSFILPPYRNKHTQLIAQVIQGKPGSLEFEIEGMHGTHRCLESYAIPLKNSEDSTTMMLSVTRDISQQKQAQAALLESEMRWKFAIEGSGDGLWDWNVPESTVFVSERWKEMLGYQGDEMANALAEWSKLDDWSKRVHPDDLAQVISDVQACLNGSTTIYKNEHRILCKDQSWKWILARGVVVSRDEQGKPLRMIGTDSDITEHKQLQQNLQASLKEKVILLNEVHHRVKNNLQVITSLLSLESARSNAPAIQQVLKNMQGRIRSMALLHQSLYRSGIFASADLGAYLQELASQAFRAQENGGSVIRLKLDLDRIMVSMDQAAPCGLLVNELISNCFKHAFPDGKDGEISLRLRAIENSNKVRLSISDSGVGLPEDFASKRENSLGLQLVTDLARQIGGCLEVGAGPEAQFIVDFVPDIQKMQNRTILHVVNES